MNRHIPVLIVALASLLAACSDKQSAAVSPVPSTSGAALQMVPGGLIDACTLLPSTDFSTLLGDNFDARSNTVLAVNNSDQFKKSGDCKVLSSKGAGKIYYAVFVGLDEPSMSAKYKQGLWAANNNQVMPGLKTDDVAGAGTAAYSYHYKFGPGFSNSDVTVVVQNGVQLVTVTLQNFPGDTDSQIGKAKGLAVRLLGKL